MSFYGAIEFETTRTEEYQKRTKAGLIPATRTVNVHKTIHVKSTESTKLQARKQIEQYARKFKGKVLYVHAFK